jgi:transcription initiation factor TFIID subunit TAF12
MHAYRLAEKIRAARVNKERAMQLQEKAQIKQQQVSATAGSIGHAVGTASCTGMTPAVSGKGS